MKKVVYDIYESDYYFKVDDLTFYFSSEFNRKRFTTKYINYVNEETYKIKAKYHVNIEISKYLLFAFYKKIEKRGFRVLTYKNDDIIELNEDYIFKTE